MLTKQEFLKALVKALPEIENRLDEMDDRQLRALGKTFGLDGFLAETKETVVRKYTPNKVPCQRTYADVDGPVIQDKDGELRKVSGLFVPVQAIDHYIAQLQLAKKLFSEGNIVPEPPKETDKNSKKRK